MKDVVCVLAYLLIVTAPALATLGVMRKDRV